MNMLPNLCKQCKVLVWLRTKPTMCRIPNGYGRWVYVVQSLMVLILLLALLRQGVFIGVPLLAFVVGFTVTLVCAGRKSKNKAMTVSQPRTVLVLLTALPTMVFFLAFILGALVYHQVIHIMLAINVTKYLCVILTLVSLFGILKGGLESRCWLSIYLLGLSLLLFFVLIFAVLYCMDATEMQVAMQLQTLYVQLIVLLAVGAARIIWLLWQSSPSPQLKRP